MTKNQVHILRHPVCNQTTYLIHSCSRQEDLQFNWIRTECKVSNYPADVNTLLLAQVALNGLLQSNSSRPFIVSQSTAVSGTKLATHIHMCQPFLDLNPLCRYTTACA